MNQKSLKSIKTAIVILMQRYKKRNVFIGRNKEFPYYENRDVQFKL